MACFRLLLLTLLLGPLLPAQDPAGAQWIWGAWSETKDRPAGEPCYFRYLFDLPADPAGSSPLYVVCDNAFELWVNGRRLGQGSSWTEAEKFELGSVLRKGRNTIAILGRNEGGPAALMSFGQVALLGREPFRIESRNDWRTHPQEVAGWTEVDFEDSNWQAARSFGGFGAQPWLRQTVWDFEARFQPMEGCRVDRLATGVGSLIAMTLDREDRPCVSVEGGGVLRLIDADGDRRFESHEVLTEEVRNTQGLCWLNEDLYLVGEGPQGLGIYRKRFPVDGSEPHDPERLAKVDGWGGEHGPHAILPGPDRRLYVALGNHCQLGESVRSDSPYRSYYEGYLLPRLEDPRGHANGMLAPGGVVISFDPEKLDWQLESGGMRNAYDLAFNRRGELFSYDADMEWDIGLPWYRPVRLLHLIPGGEYGWRTGASKWPAEYPDSLPAALDVGRGSPTGLVRYPGGPLFPGGEDILFGADWAQGLIFAFHLRPRGASYVAESQVILRGRPLNVTDLEIDRDGNLLFTTGGRGTRGALFRLSRESPSEEDRTTLWSYGRGVSQRPFGSSSSLPELLQALGDEDRWRRYEAARELERRPMETWEAAIAKLETPLARAEGLLVAARLGLQREDAQRCRQALVRALNLVGDVDGVTRTTCLRVLDLLLQDSDAPTAEHLPDMAETFLLPLYPTGDRLADRQLAELLAHMQPPGAIAAMLENWREHPFREEQIHLAYCLSSIENGWQREDLIALIDWLDEAQDWPGGMSFQGYLLAIQSRFEQRLSPAERTALAQRRELRVAKPLVLPPASEPLDFERTLSFVQQTIRSPRRLASEGARVFEQRCAGCHAFGQQGRGVGPELTTVANRFAIADMLEAVLAPNREVSDQYRSLNVLTRDGKAYHGMPILDDGRRLRLLLADQSELEIEPANVRDRFPSTVSLMPSDLLSDLSLEQVADLFAYLYSPPEPVVFTEESEWKSLFDGESLNGWRGEPELWRVENRTIVGRGAGLPHSRFLISEETYGDFLFEYDLHVVQGNSGLQFRSQEIAPFRLQGYQADAGQVYWGALYEEGGRGMLVPSVPELWKPHFVPQGWNHYVVEARGDQLRIELNGVTTATLRDQKQARGFFGFQLHAGDSQIRIRNLRLRRLDQAH